MKRMDRSGWAAVLAGVLGLIAAAMSGKLALDWAALTTPMNWIGQGLRWLSLSGVPGNLCAWAVTLAICALPLLLLRKPGQSAMERLLGVLMVPALFCTVFFLVNPTWLDTPLREMYPFAGLCTVLSLLLSRWVLGLLRRMEGQENVALSKALSLLLTICGVLLSYQATFTALSEGIAFWESSQNGGIQILLLLLRMVLNLLTVWVMLSGAELAAHLGELDFDPEAVVLCDKTARICVWVVRRTVEIAACINLLQLLCFESMQNTDFRAELPLFSLALSAGLFLLCRLLRRGQALQEDNESII